MIKGIKVCKQADTYWIIYKREILKVKVLWLTGEFINKDQSEDSDEYALSNGYISIVPVKHDLTDYESINKIQSWNL